MRAKKSKRKARRRGRLVIISAPSGCGKTTIIERLCKRHPSYWFSISVTTRPPRSTEKNRRDYYFVTPKTFFAMRNRGEFLEWAKVFGHYYGTPAGPVKDKIRKGKIAILAVDVKGAKKVRRALPTVSIFVLPPSFNDLRRRLKKRRTDSKAEITRRLEIARRELKEAGSYDHIITNRKVGDTVRMIEKVLKRK